MRSTNRRDFVIVAVASLCLGVTWLSAIPVFSVQPYDPWRDLNDDGVIDAKDFQMMKNAIPSLGTPLTKAYLAYDSGWINIADEAGQHIYLNHNLNSTDLIADITGKTTLDGGAHQQYLGGANAVVGTTGWTYGGTGYERANAVVQSDDGGYVLAGWTDSYGAGLDDGWLVKTDSNGQILWSRTYGSIGYDRVYALIKTSDGGYALAGETDPSDSGLCDFWLVRTDDSGTMLWAKRYGGSFKETANFVIETIDGGFALAGFTTSFGSGQGDFWLVKTDSMGNPQWNKTYGGGGPDLANCVIEIQGGGYALCGYTGSFGAGGIDAWLITTDINGNTILNRTYGGPNDDTANRVIQTADGGYTLVGYTTSFGMGDWDIWIARTDADGNAIWNKTYGGPYPDYAQSAIQTSDGGYTFGGTTFSFGAGSADFWLVKVDGDGNAQWNMTYGGTGEEHALSIVQTTDGGYALAGLTDSYGAGSMDFWLVKTDASGQTAATEYFEYGLAWVDSSANVITLYRGTKDPYWNFVQVRLWAPK